MAIAIGLAAAVLGISAIAAAAPPPAGRQTTPAAPLPTQDDRSSVTVTGPRPDIDLSGPKPVLRGGLWRFDRVGFHTGDQVRKDGFVNGRSVSRPFHFSTCLSTDDPEGTLRKAAGERSSFPQATICDRLQLTVGKGRISGRRGCIMASQTSGTSHSNLEITLSGRYDARRLSVIMNGNEITDGPYTERAPRADAWQWRVTASRLGDCPAKPVQGERRFPDAVNLLFSPSPSDLDIDGI